tara:strand:+ start:54 stop:296 length:243 start_codon:yes stop_codon:yes gene_type:complete
MMETNLEVKLAHGAVAHLLSRKVSVPIGDITLNMDYDSFIDFSTQMQEIAISFAAAMEVQAYACEACGAVNEVLQEKEYD